MTAILGSPGIVQTPPRNFTDAEFAEAARIEREIEANDHQVGGRHYKELEPQPWDVIAAWNMNYFAGCVLKYIARYRAKDGLKDLLKAKHYLEKLIEQEESRARLG